MSAREQAEVIAANVRASLRLAAEHGLTIEQALESGVDRAIGNNAAQALSLADDDTASA